jgi:hypothetical protein
VVALLLVLYTLLYGSSLPETEVRTARCDLDDPFLIFFRFPMMVATTAGIRNGDRWRHIVDDVDQMKSARET